MSPEVLIIGCGFLGEAAAELFSRQGRSVLGVVRSPESLRALEGRSFETVCCDITDQAAVEALAQRVRGTPLAIHAVSAGSGGPGVYEAVYREALRGVIGSWQPGRVLFVSSTSVYGQNDGSWVTEESPAEPERETGTVLLQAEALALAAGGSVVRLSGIYGPGRSFLLRRYLAGEAVLEGGGGRWMNQIHRDDGAAALVRIGDSSSPSGIYNVSDDTPATQRELYGWMASCLGRPLPPKGPENLHRPRGVTSKKVSNRKLRALGWSPQFPSYRDALPQLLSSFREGNS